MHYVTSFVKPICVNCVYSRIRHIDMEYICTKMYNIDLVTGNKIYFNASECRKLDTLCGINGKHYVEMPPPKK